MTKFAKNKQRVITYTATNAMNMLEYFRVSATTRGLSLSYSRIYFDRARTRMSV